MKLFIALTFVLALLAFTQAQQDDSNQAEIQSDAKEQQVDLEEPQSEPKEPSSDPSDEPKPPKPEDLGRPPRPERPGRHHFGRRHPRPQPSEDQLADNASPESNPRRVHPPRRPVFFDIKYGFGSQNHISANHQTSTASY